MIRWLCLINLNGEVVKTFLSKHQLTDQFGDQLSYLVILPIRRELAENRFVPAVHEI